MNLQQNLNNDAINKLHSIKECLSLVDQNGKDQIMHLTLNALSNSNTALDNMTVKQKMVFENDMIDLFNYKNMFTN